MVANACALAIGDGATDSASASHSGNGASFTDNDCSISD